MTPAGPEAAERATQPSRPSPPRGAAPRRHPDAGWPPDSGRVGNVRSVGPVLRPRATKRGWQRCFAPPSLHSAASPGSICVTASLTSRRPLPAPAPMPRCPRSRRRSASPAPRSVLTSYSPPRPASRPGRPGRELAWISTLISFAAFAERCAKARTSDATTAKPRPASPARAASTPAFNASRLVWNAMSSITPMIWPICRADVSIRSSPCTALSTTVPESAASDLACRATPCACPAPLRRPRHPGCDLAQRRRRFLQARRLLLGPARKVVRRLADVPRASTNGADAGVTTESVSSSRPMAVLKSVLSLA